MEENKNATFGITDIFIDAINKKYDGIRDLNSLKVNLDEENFEEMIPVIDSILEDENNHIGKLQQLIDLLSGSESDIEEGKQETIEIIDNNEFVESITPMKKKLVLSENFDNVIDDVQAVADPTFVGANEEHDENKKKYEDAMKENKKEAEDTVPKEGETGEKVKSKALKQMHLSEELFGEELSFEDYSDFNSAICHAISDVIVEFRDKGITKDDLDKALEWFDFHFWNDEYDENYEDEVNESLNESIQSWGYSISLDGEGLLASGGYESRKEATEAARENAKYIKDIVDEEDLPRTDFSEKDLYIHVYNEYYENKVNESLNESLQIDESKFKAAISNLPRQIEFIENKFSKNGIDLDDYIKSVELGLDRNDDLALIFKFYDDVPRLEATIFEQSKGSYVIDSSYIYNILYETIKRNDLKESIQYSIAKEQIKRFTEGKMPKNWNVDSYLKKLTEKKHINKKEAKSLKEWYSRIK